MVKIYRDEEKPTLMWEGDRLATKQEYELADRCIGSIFEALEPNEIIILADGVFKLDENLDLIHLPLESELAKFLPLAKYGKDSAKDFEDLLAEIQSGEANIRQRESGQYVRLIDVVCVRVFCHTKSLWEDKQVFADGRVRKRNLEGLSEKAMSQNYEAEAYRAIEEELGLGAEAIAQISQKESTKKVNESGSYPGLLTEYTFHNFEVYLFPEFYNPEGYQEVQKAKTTYFVWRET